MTMPAFGTPAFNAALNGLSAVLLAVGFLLIRRKNVNGHRACMSLAFVSSVVFLISYLYYHLRPGHHLTRFAGEGIIQGVYFTILGTHTLLAMTVPPLAIVTLTRAMRKQFDRHRAIARWTLPIWMYVSVTGVIVYVMLYHLFPHAGGA